MSGFLSERVTANDMARPLRALGAFFYLSSVKMFHSEAATSLECACLSGGLARISLICT